MYRAINRSGVINEISMMLWPLCHATFVKVEVIFSHPCLVVEAFNLWLTTKLVLPSHARRSHHVQGVWYCDAHPPQESIEKIVIVPRNRNSRIPVAFGKNRRNGISI